MVDELNKRRVIFRWNSHHWMWEIYDRKTELFLNDFHDCMATRMIFRLNETNRLKDNFRIIRVEDDDVKEETKA